MLFERVFLEFVTASSGVLHVDAVAAAHSISIINHGSSDFHEERKHLLSAESVFRTSLSHNVSLHVKKMASKNEGRQSQPRSIVVGIIANCVHAYVHNRHPGYCR